MDKVLVVDGNNIVHKNYHTEKKRSDNVNSAIDYAISKSILDFKMFYDKYTPNTTILAFDSGMTWREVYTKSDDSVTGKIYKANRSENKTKKELEAKAMLNTKIAELVEVLRETRLFILQEPKIEADDFAGAICDMYKDEYDTEVIVVSSDKDYLQFLRYDNVRIVNPMKHGKKRTLDEWNGDVELMLFEKCIRGDGGDNVRSSYPRLKKTKLIEAFYDDLKRTNIMNHEFEEMVYCDVAKDYVQKTFKTSEVFKENELLVRLDSQPDHIKKIIRKRIIDEMGTDKKLNILKFVRYVSKNELGNLKSQVTQFTDLLNNKPK